VQAFEREEKERNDRKNIKFLGTIKIFAIAFTWRWLGCSEFEVT
jgi:hypothetical protein